MGDESLSQLLEIHSTLELLDRNLKEANQFFASIDHDERAKMATGFTATCAVSQLASLSIPEAKEGATASLQALDYDATSQAMKLAGDTSRSRKQAMQELGASVWGLIHNTLLAKCIAAEFEVQKVPEEHGLAYARNVAESLFAKIDGYIRTYAAASADELKAMGLFSAARAIDPSLHDTPPRTNDQKAAISVAGNAGRTSATSSPTQAAKQTTAQKRPRQGGWVWKFILGLFAIAIAIAVFIHMQKPLATWSGLAQAETLGEITGSAVGLFIVAGLLPVVVWAFGRFRAKSAPAPLFVWFVLLLGAGAMLGYGQNIRAEKIYQAMQGAALDDKARHGFISATRSSCIETQTQHPLNQEGGATADQIAAYCDCYANGLGQEITADELIYFAKNRKPSPSTQITIEQLQPICIREAIGE